MNRPPYWLIALIFLALWSLGICDDCSTPEDAMDTAGVGPPIKAAISAIIAAVVNGETILTTIIKGDGGDEESDEDEDPSEFTLDVTTEDQQTTLVVDAPEGLWTYASVRVVNPPEGYNPLADLQTVAFSGPSHLSISAAQMRGDTKAVQVRAVSPGGDQDVPREATLTVSATLNGNPISVPVVFTIDQGYELVITTRSEWLG